MKKIKILNKKFKEKVNLIPGSGIFPELLRLKTFVQLDHKPQTTNQLENPTGAARFTQRTTHVPVL